MTYKFAASENTILWPEAARVHLGGIFRGPKISHREGQTLGRHITRAEMGIGVLALGQSGWKPG